MKITGKIGYVHSRSGMISEDEQIKLLMDYGVEAEHIYKKDDTIKEAVKSCYNTGDLLVVWSAACIGAHAYSATVKSLAKQGANIYILKRKMLLDCKAGLPFAEALGDIQQQGKSGEGKGGRYKSISPEKAEKIIAFVDGEGNQKQAAEHFETSTRVVHEIVKGIYFK